MSNGIYGFCNILFHCIYSVRSKGSKKEKVLEVVSILYFLLISCEEIKKRSSSPVVAFSLSPKKYKKNPKKK